MEPQYKSNFKLEFVGIEGSEILDSIIVNISINNKEIVFNQNVVNGKLQPLDILQKWVRCDLVLKLLDKACTEQSASITLVGFEIEPSDIDYDKILGVDFGYDENNPSSSILEPMTCKFSFDSIRVNDKDIGYNDEIQDTTDPPVYYDLPDEDVDLPF